MTVQWRSIAMCASDINNLVEWSMKYGSYEGATKPRERDGNGKQWNGMAEEDEQISVQH
jgi:hypothetical protein